MMQTGHHWSLVAPVTGNDDDERVQVYRVSNPCWIENWVRGVVVEALIAGVDPATGNVLVKLPGVADPCVFAWDEGIFARKDFTDETLVPADVYET